MPVTPEDVAQYNKFLEPQLKALKCLDFDSETTLLWHYTTGQSLQAIIESGTIYSTQVSCLNDSSEIRYASSLFKNALNALLTKYSGESAIESFLKKYLKLIEEEPDRPNHAPSPFFVSCFSAHEDDLSQWRSYCGGENGYAIGFRASGLVGVPNSLLVKVNYDKVTHENIASQVAEATVRFFREGLEQKRADTAEKWEDEFLARWDPLITYLAPMVKDPGFSSENEYRIVHELQISELKDMKFIQKSTMMSRHLPLRLPAGGEMWVPRLPFVKVLVGPCRHREITRITVDTLLRKWGYGAGMVFSSSGHSSKPERPYNRLYESGYNDPSPGTSLHANLRANRYYLALL